MGKTVLLTLGRLPKGLEMARCLHGAGHRVLVADPFSLHLSKPSRAVAKSFQIPAPATDQAPYLDALATLCRDHQVDLVIPVSEEVMHVAKLAERLPAHTTLMSESQRTLLKLHDKYAFIEGATASGLRAPESYLGDDVRADAIAAEADTVAKARFGCSGAKLHFLTAGMPIPDPLKTRDWVIQRAVRGREVSTQSICRDGEVLGHVVYRGLIYSGTVSVAFERIEEPAVDQWVRDHVAATRFSGFTAFDFIIDEDGTPWPLECNPRLTSGIHFFDHEDLATLVVGDTLDHPLRFKPQTRFQEGHTALTKAYSMITKPRRYLQTLKTIASCRDVLWSSRDPFVFPLMTPMSWPVLKQAIFDGRNFGEAATLDIEWQPSASDVSGAAPPQLEVRAS